MVRVHTEAARAHTAYSGSLSPPGERSSSFTSTHPPADLPKDQHRVDYILDGDGAHGALELFVAERQPRIAVQVVHYGACQLWIVGHFLRVQSQPHHFAG